VGAGIVQLVAGIFFLISLPIFKMGSNIWAGAWVSKWTLTSLVKLIKHEKESKRNIEIPEGLIRTNFGKVCNNF
jgi:hypothetical protein